MTLDLWRRRQTEHNLKTHFMKMGILLSGVLAAATTMAEAATNDTTTALQKGLFEEEANRNLDAAIQAYRSVVSQFDKDRKIAATAVFRLGECYRKQGHTNEASAQYERVLREFGEQAPLVTLSRQNLVALGGLPAAAEKTGSGLIEAGATQAEAAGLKAQVERLAKLPPAEKRIAVQQELPNPVLTELMQKLAGAEQNLAIWRRSFGSNHPEVLTASTLGETINRQIDSQVEAALQGLEARQKAAEAKAAVLAQTGSTSKQDSASSPATSSEAEEVRRIQAMIKDSPDLINARQSNELNPLQDAASKGELTVAEFLLNNGAEISIGGGSSGYTALHYAANQGHKAMVELLLQHGAAVDARAQSGETALHLAAGRGFKNVAESLLAQGADANARDDQNGTPLFRAAGQGRLALAQFLIEKGADVNSKDNSGKTALVTAIVGKHVPVIELLLTNKAEVNTECSVNINNSSDRRFPLHCAVELRRTDIAELLLKHGANPNAQVSTSPPGPTPLVLAIAEGQREMAALLLRYKADPNIPTKDGVSPLQLAVGAHSPELVELLLKNKADADYQGRGGRTASHFAAGAGHKEILSLLLSAGANPNVQDDSGKTPLHWAVENGPKEVVELLLEKGADPNVADNQGLTALAMVQQPLGSAPGAFPPLPAPRRPLRPGENPQLSAKAVELAELLRQHGAVEDLPRPDAIRVARPSTKAGYTIFSKGTNDWNQFTLLELIAVQFSFLSASSERADTSGYDASAFANVFCQNNTFAFPDLAHIRVREPGKDSKTWQDRTVDFRPVLEEDDCSKDIRLPWGAIVETPEADHPLNTRWRGFSPKELTNLKNCLARSVQIIVKGEASTLTLAPKIVFPTGPESEPTIYPNTPFWLRPVLLNSGRVLSSSDLTRVKVTRQDKATGQKREWVVDCSDWTRTSDLWLRDGDVIEVPDRT
jgi:ankyrin repeat protein